MLDLGQLLDICIAYSNHSVETRTQIIDLVREDFLSVGKIKPDTRDFIEWLNNYLSRNDIRQQVADMRRDINECCDGPQS